MRSDDPLCVGAIGATGTPAANELAAHADVVIGIGTRWSDFTTASRTAFAEPKVQFVNINVGVVRRGQQSGVAVVADARAALDALALRPGRVEGRACLPGPGRGAELGAKLQQEPKGGRGLPALVPQQGNLWRLVHFAAGVFDRHHQDVGRRPGVEGRPGHGPVPHRCGKRTFRRLRWTRRSCRRRGDQQIHHRRHVRESGPGARLRKMQSNGLITRW